VDVYIHAYPKHVSKRIFHMLWHALTFMTCFDTV
jgi:hypothetical protein